MWSLAFLIFHALVRPPWIVKQITYRGFITVLPSSLSVIIIMDLNSKSNTNQFNFFCLCNLITLHHYFQSLIRWLSAIFLSIELKCLVRLIYIRGIPRVLINKVLNQMFNQIQHACRCLHEVDTEQKKCSWYVIFSFSDSSNM